MGTETEGNECFSYVFFFLFEGKKYNFYLSFHYSFPKEIFKIIL